MQNRPKTAVFGVLPVAPLCLGASLNPIAQKNSKWMYFNVKIDTEGAGVVAGPQRKLKVVTVEREHPVGACPCFSSQFRRNSKRPHQNFEYPGSGKSVPFDKLWQTFCQIGSQAGQGVFSSVHGAALGPSHYTGESR